MKNKPKTITLLEISESAQKRVALISKEFTDGFEFIKNYPRSVTFFGSARIQDDSEFYNKSKNLAERIVKELRYSVVTGGGPGIMKAANKGAFEAGGNSVGLNIELPREQSTNDYLTDKMEFHYFFSRKVCLSFSAEAYLFFPGGFGTFDEFMEILTLMQTGKIAEAPIILVGESFWNPLREFFKANMISGGYVAEKDLDLFTITDNEDKILEIIKNAPVRMGIEYNAKSERPIKKNGHNGDGPINGLLNKYFR